MEAAAVKRYNEKISIIKGVDPYTLDPKNGSDDVDEFPRCNLWSIGNYLVHKTSTYTTKDFNAYRSLQAFTQFACGWVTDVFVYKIDSWHVVVGKVMHSMRVREKPLNTWVIAAKHGEIESAHCSCMAGLGEACTHIAALLFYVESITKFIHEKSSTDVPAYWTAPAAVKKVSMAPIDEVDFKKKKLCGHNKENNNPPKKMKVEETSDEEYKTFLKELSEVKTTTPIALLLIEKPFCDKYANPRNKELNDISWNPDEIYPPRLRDLFKEELQKESLSHILSIADTLQVKANPEQCFTLEKDTRQQAKSKLWFHYRAGRITASVMKRVCAASITKPPLSLLKQIVYPEKSKFLTKAMQWGCTHELIAKKAYEDIQKSKHPGFAIQDAGFYISTEFPHIGATPDGIVSCLCCGKGCIEIKCPYCLRYSSPEDIIESSDFLGKNQKSLKKDHMYYYQIQTQLFTTKLPFCDFVVWTKDCVYIERICPDITLWDKILEKANPFFKKVILPELLAKVWTEPPKNDIPSSSKSSPLIIKVNKV